MALADEIRDLYYIDQMNFRADEDGHARSDFHVG
jgi:hypothetical protein